MIKIRNSAFKVALVEASVVFHRNLGPDLFTSPLKQTFSAFPKDGYGAAYLF